MMWSHFLRDFLFQLGSDKWASISSIVYDYSSFIIFLQNVAMQSRKLKNHNGIFVMTNFLHVNAP